MKKVLFAIILLCVSTAGYAKCENGDVFVGINDEHEYCISKAKMSWKEAFEWCENNERHLSSLQEACKEWDGDMVRTCENLASHELIERVCWTANLDATTLGYQEDELGWRVNVGTGGTSPTPSFFSNYTFFALCY